MDKFYVQSGTLRSIVQAETPRKAALWAVHKVMQQIMPLDGEDAVAGKRSRETEGSGETQGSDTPVAVLGGRVRISQRGYDRDDASEMPTLDVVAEWNQMVTTLDRLERMMYRAA